MSCLMDSPEKRYCIKTVTVTAVLLASIVTGRPKYYRGYRCSTKFAPLP